MDSKYRTLVETLKRNILSGKYENGNSFPSVRALIKRYGLSNTTVLHAMDDLVREGLVSRKQGRGTFVTGQGQGASRKIGLIVPGVAVTDFYLPIISEINGQAREAGYALHFAEVFSTDREERIRQVRELAAEFVHERVAGVIFEPLAGPSGTEANEHIIRVLDRVRIPTVLLDCDIVPFPDRSGHDVIGINDVEAGAVMVRHLLSVGARRIHFLMGSSIPTTFVNRLYGAKSAIREWGTCCKMVVFTADPTDAAALKRHLRKHGRPDAFVCSNDLNAAVFKQTLEAVGLTVPKNVMLAGFADLPVASLMTPALTTIHQSRAQMGRTAFQRLLERMNDMSLPPNEILFPAPLVVRESTCRVGRGRKKKGRKI